MVGSRRTESTLSFAIAPRKTPLEHAVLGACLLRVVLTSSSDSRYVNYHDRVVTNTPKLGGLEGQKSFTTLGCFWGSGIPEQPGWGLWLGLPREGMVPCQLELQSHAGLTRA